MVRLTLFLTASHVHLPYGLPRLPDRPGDISNPCPKAQGQRRRTVSGGTISALLRLTARASSRLRRFTRTSPNSTLTTSTTPRKIMPSRPRLCRVSPGARTSSSHHHRVCAWQLHEYWSNPGRICLALPSNRGAFRVPLVGCPMGFTHRPDGRTLAGPSPRMGVPYALCIRPGIQYRQWRHLPLEMDVVAQCGMVRYKSSTATKKGPRPRDPISAVSLLTGVRSLRSTNSSSPISTGSPPHGVLTPTSPGPSRLSPI